jgi:hypothetical protein
MGTTRMSDDPAQGVVDRNLKVHGLANLYVAGSSVFPTPGSGTPTMTIVALALRLARHLEGVGGVTDPRTSRRRIPRGRGRRPRRPSRSPRSRPWRALYEATGAQGPAAAAGERPAPAPRRAPAGPPRARRPRRPELARADHAGRRHAARAARRRWPAPSDDELRGPAGPQLARRLRRRAHRALRRLGAVGDRGAAVRAGGARRAPPLLVLTSD